MPRLILNRIDKPGDGARFGGHLSLIVNARTIGESIET